MRLYAVNVCVVFLVVFTSAVLGDGYWKRQSMMMSPPKTIHVHHFDGGMSNNGMSGNYMKGGHGSSSGGGLIELLLLSSLLGGNGGLFGGTATTGLVQQAAVPIQVPVVG